MVTIQRTNVIVNQYFAGIGHCKNEGKFARIQIITYYLPALSSIFYQYEAFPHLNLY